MEGRFDWGRYDFGTFRRRDVLTMGRFDCKAQSLSLLDQTMDTLTDSVTEHFHLVLHESLSQVCSYLDLRFKATYKQS